MAGMLAHAASYGSSSAVSRNGNDHLRPTSPGLQRPRNGRCCRLASRVGCSTAAMPPEAAVVPSYALCHWTKPLTR